MIYYPIIVKEFTLGYQKEKRYIPYIHLGHDLQLYCNSLQVDIIETINFRMKTEK